MSSSFSLHSLSLLFLSFPLSEQLILNHLGQGLQVEADEHVEGVLLSVLGQAGELSLAELLQFRSESQVLPVELLLLLPGQSLPGCGVSEGGQTKLLILQLLRDGKSLSWCQHQCVCVSKINVSKMTNQSFSLLSI